MTLKRSIGGWKTSCGYQTNANAFADALVPGGGVRSNRRNENLSDVQDKSDVQNKNHPERHLAYGPISSDRTVTTRGCALDFSSGTVCSFARSPGFRKPAALPGASIGCEE